jgi:hypothetical protein
MTVRNDEALNSSIYNPVVPERTLQIYQLMDPNDPSLLEEYREIILSGSTRNPYRGAIYNPRACEIDQNRTTLNEIMNLLEERWRQIQLEGQPQYTDNIADPGYPVQTYTPTQEQADLYAEWAALYPGMRADLQTAWDTLNQFQDHTDRQISNLPSNIGMAQNAMGLDTLLLGLLNPCLGLDAFFGSLMALGRRIMAEIAAAIQQVMNIINQIIAQIQQMINMVMAKIQEVIQMIQNEISALVGAFIKMLQSGLAWLLDWLPDDPCLKALLGAVATGGLNAILSR